MLRNWLSIASLYWHTIRFLKAIQIFHRLVLPFKKLFRVRIPEVGVRIRSGEWSEVARREPTLLGPTEFYFLGVSGDLSIIGWDGVEREKLWRYHQHYFDDLNARNTSDRRSWHDNLLTLWVKDNPVGIGAGWEAYPTSIRIVNWIKWSLSGNRLSSSCVNSLAVQCQWLSQMLEYHLLGNHLLANAKALIFGGLFFDGKDAERWRMKGFRILNCQLKEQVLPDGGHFELSPMYHSILVEDVLDILNVLTVYTENQDIKLVRELRSISERMLIWLSDMLHPDGEISFFNDAAFGMSSSPTELFSYAERLGICAKRLNRPKSVWLKESGYARLGFDTAVAILDVGQIGPDYLPGHAHADNLSFELSVHGERVLVNSGTSCYGNSAERLRQRGTSAHNTVVVRNENSSEVWGGFRVARRARSFIKKIELSKDQSEVICCHDGYTRLRPEVLHSRTWKMDGTSMIVLDKLNHAFECSLAKFFVHPSARVFLDEYQRSGEIVLRNGEVVTFRVLRGVPVVELSTWHPGFGVTLPSRCIVIRLVDGESQVRWAWK